MAFSCFRELLNNLSHVNRLSIFLGLFCPFYSVFISGTVIAEADSLPPVSREFRAAWIATVANIDWPSRPGRATKQQQAELIAIIDRAAELNLNALVFQVRPHCDALYDSQLEPWSEYLTGTMGQPPDPHYDPLELAVNEAHARGIELHVWFNPFRAFHPAAKSELSSTHVSRTKPGIVREYGKHLWLDPGEPEAAEHTLAVILDVVKRYDVDGVHFDDYFYPYPINDAEGNRLPFPDETSWRRRAATDKLLSRSDWRRKNVDSLVRRVHEQIRKNKPWVKFGISPFGIWRPGHPQSVTGFDAYENLYADARKWFQSGWVDYFTPQLYWAVESKGQSYPTLLDWWHQQNKLKRHLWPGNFSSRVANESSGNWKVDEILKQIEITRGQEGAQGNVHFSMKALMDDRGLAEALRTGPYRQPALVPASPWLKGHPPGTPKLSISNARLRLKLQNGISPWLWVLQFSNGAQWQTQILPGATTEIPLSVLELEDAVDRVAVSAVNRVGEIGPAQEMKVTEK